MTHRMMLFSRLLSFHVHRSSVTKLSEKLISHISEGGGDNPMRTNSEIVPLKRVERKKSYVWQYFSKINKSKAKCSICNREFVVKYGNTSCLSRHLTSIRNENLNTSSMMEQPLHSNNRNIQYLSKNSRRAKKLTAAIARMIILDLQPYSKVDDIGLQSLLKIAEPRYEIPSHATFSRSIILYMNNALRKDIQSKVNTDIKEDN